MASELEVAWASGLFEGEGCFTRSDHNGNAKVIAKLTSTDRDVLDRFFDVVDVGKIYGPWKNKSTDKPYWQWICSRTEDVIFVFKLFKPWLGERRSETGARLIQGVIDDREERRVRPRGPKSRAVVGLVD